MTRTSVNKRDFLTGNLLNGYDYVNQAWVKDGKYQDCGHPVIGEWSTELQAFSLGDCGCYGRLHHGEQCEVSGNFDHDIDIASA